MDLNKDTSLETIIDLNGKNLLKAYDLPIDDAHKINEIYSGNARKLKK